MSSRSGFRWTKFCESSVLALVMWPMVAVAVAEDHFQANNPTRARAFLAFGIVGTFAWNVAVYESLKMLF